MRKAKRYLALLMAGVLAVTSVNLPTMSAYAQDVGDSVVETQEATPGDAEEIVDIGEGVTKVNITTGGQKKKFRFTPDEDGLYACYSQSDEDTKVTLYDSEGTEIAFDDDSGEDHNFRLLYNMKAGKTYIISAYYYSSYVTGSYDMYVEKKASAVSMTFSNMATYFLENVNNSRFVDFEATVTYADGSTAASEDVDGDSVKIDGIKYSIWIKDQNGDYVYREDDGYEIGYVEKSRLSAGTYTVVVTDYEADNYVCPSSDAKVYGSYDIYVQTAEEYFAGRENISETEKKNFSIRENVYEYYKFTPSYTGNYVFAGMDSSIYLVVQDSDYKHPDEVEQYMYNLEKGKTYYVGIMGWYYDDKGEECYNTDIIARIYSSPVKADITMSRTKFLSGMDDSVAEAVSLKIHRANGQTEILKKDGSDAYKDENGREYNLYYAPEGENWDTNRIDGSIEDAQGTYTLSVGYYEDGENKQLGSTTISVVDFDKLDLTALKMGENKIHSAKSEYGYDNNVYKFTPAFDGMLNVDSDIYYNVYQIENGTRAALSDRSVLKAGTTYYVLFYGGKYDDTEDDYVYDCTVNISEVPCVSYMKISKAPDTLDAIRGQNVDLYKGIEITVNYSNGESEKVTRGDYGFKLKNHQSLSVSFVQNEQAIDVDDLYYEEEGFNTSQLPLGNVEVVISSLNDVKCSYELNVHRVTDYVVDTLKMGENDIDTKEKKNSFYKFTPDTTAIYDLGCSVKYIGHEAVYNGAERLVCDAERVSSVLLDKGVTYYLDFSDGIEDKWGETVYSWTMDIQVAEDGAYTVPVNWSFAQENGNKKLIYTSNVSRYKLWRDIDGTAVNVSYADGTTAKAVVGNEYDYYDHESDNQIDRFNNKLRLSIQKYNVEKSEYEECSDDYFEKGQYKVVYSLIDRNGTTYSDIAPLETSFVVYDIKDAPDGEWDISNPLYITNEQNQYIYKVKVPDGVKSITFASNTDLDEMDLYDSDGYRLGTSSNVFSEYAYSRSLDVNVDELYIVISPYSSTEISKITAFDNKEVVALNTTVKRTKYTCGLDRITENNVITTVVYRDGTHKEVAGQTSGVDLYLTDENGESNGYYGSELTKTGKYKLTARSLGMSDDCKVNGTDITVEPFDASAATALQPGKSVTEENTSDEECRKVYSFTPDENMEVSFDSSGYEGCVYIMSDGELEYFCDTYEYRDVEAGVTYYIAVSIAGGATVTTSVQKYNPGKVIRDTITVGEDKELTMSERDSAYFTFVPGESGIYTIYSYDMNSNVDPYVELYKDEDNIDEDDDSGEGLHFELTADLEKGVEYTYRINTTRAGTFGVSLKHVEKDKEISSLRFLDSTFEATKKADEEYAGVSGNVEITYGDNSKDTISYSYGTKYDKYNNVIQFINNVETIDGKEKAVVEMRYRNKNSSTWSSVYTLRIDVKIEKSEITKELTEGKTFDSSSESDRVSYFTFTPKQTGKYVFNVEADYVEVIEVSFGAGDIIEPNGKTYSLTAGEQYRIELQAADDYKITILKATAIADVEIVSYKGLLYRGITGRFGDDTLEVKVTYADGTTETVPGNGSLSDGRKVEYNIDCSAPGEALIRVQVGGISAYKKVAYADKDSIESIVFKNGISNTKINKMEDATNVKAYIYKVIIPANGEYAIDYNSTDWIYMSKSGSDWLSADDILGSSLKAGDVYYIKVSADVDKFCFAPSSVLNWQTTKAVTCTKDGSRRRYDPSLGKYVTEVIPATGHSYTHYVSDNNATCLKAGTKTAKCDNGCGSKDVIEDADKPATGHSYSAKWTIVKAAGYGTDGYKAHICSRCGGASVARRAVNRITSVALVQTSYVYDGKVHKPGVVVVDSTGKMIPASKYTVTYSKNKDVGKITVKVTFKGDYAGSVNREFVIKPAATSITAIQNAATGIKISWKKAPGAGGYKVQRKSGNGKFATVNTITSGNTLSYIDTSIKRQGVGYSYRVVAYKTVSGKTYTSSASAEKAYCFVRGTAVAKAVNVKTAKIKVSWNKNSAASGYQIQYSDNSKFKGAKMYVVPTGSRTNAALVNLKKKKYYVRMRGYKNVKGITYYSAWSSAKSVVVNK